MRISQLMVTDRWLQILSQTQRVKLVTHCADMLSSYTLEPCQILHLRELTPYMGTSDYVREVRQVSRLSLDRGVVSRCD